MSNYEALTLALKDAVGKAVTLYVINGLDEDVTVQVRGNRVDSTDDAADVGDSFTVPAESSDFKSLVPEASGITPYVYVTLTCSTAPSSGSVTVYQDEGGEAELTMVDALEIRDTDTHTPDTDDEISILAWWW